MPLTADPIAGSEAQTLPGLLLRRCERTPEGEVYRQYVPASAQPGLGSGRMGKSCGAARPGADRFSYPSEMVMTLPSGGALATRPSARLPPCPGRFSMMIGWPSDWLSRSATTRATMSVVWPAGKPTSTRKVFCGWARAGNAAQSVNAAKNLQRAQSND